jgi:hypothetical protein
MSCSSLFLALSHSHCFSLTLHLPTTCSSHTKLHYTLTHTAPHTHCCSLTSLTLHPTSYSAPHCTALTTPHSLAPHLMHSTSLAIHCLLFSAFILLFTAYVPLFPASSPLTTSLLLSPLLAALRFSASYALPPITISSAYLAGPHRKGILGGFRVGTSTFRTPLPPLYYSSPPSPPSPPLPPAHRCPLHATLVLQLSIALFNSIAALCSLSITAM